ncbi:hypothetical protein O9992_19995 [Vibrio lentus]|nr:hypothetical protein [Vibrio lentus]
MKEPRASPGLDMKDALNPAANATIYLDSVKALKYFAALSSINLSPTLDASQITANHAKSENNTSNNQHF